MALLRSRRALGPPPAVGGAPRAELGALKGGVGWGHSPPARPGAGGQGQWLQRSQGTGSSCWDPRLPPTAPPRPQSARHPLRCHADSLSFAPNVLPRHPALGAFEEFAC